MRNETTVQVADEVRQDGPVLTSGQLAARLRWARRQGHPFYVWPEVPIAAWQAALAELGRVSAAVLGGRRDVVLERPASIRPAGWRSALNTAAFTSGVGPLLGWWHEQGVLDTDADTAAGLAWHLDHARARAARLEPSLHAVCRALVDAGVPVTLLKGAHTARAYFPEPGVRPMSDLDVMVAPGDVAGAESALRAAGYELVASSRVLRPYRSDWKPPDAPAAVQSLSVHHRDNPFTIDLHTGLELDFFGVRTVRLDVAGSLVPAARLPGGVTVLAQPLLVAHLAAHASLGLHNLTLLRLIELALVLRREAGRTFDWDELGAVVQQARAERFVYPAFQLVERFVPGSVEPRFLEQVTRAATPAMRTIVGRLTPATAQRLQHSALNERFMWGTTPLEHVRRVLHMVAPAGSASLRRLGRIYVERVFRLVRGRVSFRGEAFGGE